MEINQKSGIDKHFIKSSVQHAYHVTFAIFLRGKSVESPGLVPKERHYSIYGQ